MTEGKPQPPERNKEGTNPKQEEELSNDEHILLRDFDPKNLDHVAQFESVKKKTIAWLLALVRECEGLPTQYSRKDYDTEQYKKFRSLYAFIAHTISNLEYDLDKNGETQLADNLKHIIIVANIGKRDLDELMIDTKGIRDLGLKKSLEDSLPDLEKKIRQSEGVYDYSDLLETIASYTENLKVA
jgi:hypothetical protein